LRCAAPRCGALRVPASPLSHAARALQPWGALDGVCSNQSQVPAQPWRGWYGGRADIPRELAAGAWQTQAREASNAPRHPTPAPPLAAARLGCGGRSRHEHDRRVSHRVRVPDICGREGICLPRV
jgi:hypothetical protein